MNKGLLVLAVVVIGTVIYLSQGGEEVAHEASTAPAAVEVERTIGPVSYTHLTLPTILRV